MATYQHARNRVQAGFWIHVACYLIVIGSLGLVNFQLAPENLWFLWAAGGWGIGIAAHAFAFFGNRDHLIERAESRIDRRQERQRHREYRRDAR